ncbi:MAG: hypothetical protein IT435_04460 [Phycisphaerales bacterium]|nr:hypothetical protein [Phycisphaerales bacterium]
MSRADYLNRCDAALADKPRLAAVFDAAWRGDLRARALAEPQDPAFGYPTAYWWPMLDLMSPGGAFAPEVQARMETGLDVLWPKMTERDRSDVTARLRAGGPSVCDELLAAAAFAVEFGREAVTLPTAAPHERKPEFFVEVPPARWAVECRQLQDAREVQVRNDQMIRTGQPWITPAQPDRDANRLRSAIVGKIKRAQGGGPTFIILSSYTPWLMPDEMQAVVRRILREPGSVGLAESDLPIGIACLFWTVVQGVWFCDPACAAASIEGPLRERIRRAVVRGFVPRTDTEILTETGW